MGMATIFVGPVVTPSTVKMDQFTMATHLVLFMTKKIVMV